MTDCFIVGCGYVGKRVAIKELEHGSTVKALVKRESKIKSLQALGLDVVARDLDAKKFSTPDLSESVLYWFAPPPPVGLSDSRIASFLNSIKKSSLPSRLVLISTTGVYGDCKGAWVTESQPTDPTTDRARRRVDAEDFVRYWCRENRVATVILRVPAIYGPGRLPIEQLKLGKHLPSLDKSPLVNRIHVSDLVRACFASARIDIDRNVKLLEICNISDGNPSTTTEFFLSVAKCLGLPHPSISVHEKIREVSDSGIFKVLDSKRIDNTRMRKWLGVSPDFPTVEIGLTYHDSLSDDL